MEKRIKKLMDIWIFLKFDVAEFEILFPENQENDPIRTEIIPDFLIAVSDFYWDHFMMTIARLLDPNEQGQNQNLSLLTLCKVAKELGFNQIEPIKSRIETLKEKFSDVRYFRMKHLAHFDLRCSIGEQKFEFNTHITDVKFFLDEMLSIINMTLEIIGNKPESGAICYPARYYGAKDFIQVLENELKRRNGVI